MTLNEQNPGPKLIKMCDEEAKQARKRALCQSTSNNIRHFNKHALMKGNQLASMPIKELIRTIDAEEEENECVASKFKELKHLVDVKARRHLTKIPMTASALKCYYGCNQYGVREKLIKAGTTNSECPRCSDEETWEHVVQCRKTVIMRVEFILA